MAKSLKAMNAWIINAAILVEFLGFVWVAAGMPALNEIGSEDILGRAQAALAPGAASLAIIAIVGLILRGVLPSSVRDGLVHLRWRNPLPGSRAFSAIGPRDPRVDMKKLKAAYGPLPRKPGEQNSKFYSIYREFRDEPGVLDAHRSYLLARDLSVVSFFCTITLPFGAWFATGPGRTAIWYGLVLLVVTLVLCIAAKSYGRRFVENTLSVASHKSLG